MLEKKIIKLLGHLYLRMEKKTLADEPEIMGVRIDEDLRKYSREELCREFDKALHYDVGTFYTMASTQKIRLGTQMLRNLYGKRNNGVPYVKFEKRLEEK